MGKKIQRFLKRKQVISILGNDYALTDIQHDRLLKFFDQYGYEKKCEEWYKALAFMIKYDLSNYVGRIRRLKQLSASPNNYSLVIRYGKFWKLHRTLAAENRTRHYPNRINYWLDRGYTISEATEKVREIQINRSRCSSVVRCGTSEYSCRSILFWIKKGLTEEQATKEVTRVQHRKKTPEIVSKWMNTMNEKSTEEKQQIRIKQGHSVESFIARGHSIDDSIRMSNAYYAKRNNFSKTSQAFFVLLENFFNSNTVYYKSKNYEKQFFGKCVDFYDAETKTVVEFYGDFWHRNPAIYPSYFCCYDKTSEEIWNSDKLRIEKIQGHPEVNRVIIVWEKQVLMNPHLAATEIMQEINNGN